MEKGEKRALIYAGLGHVGLVLFLSVGIISTSRKLPQVQDVVPVDIVDIAAVPSAPSPAPRTAPNQGPDELPQEQAEPAPSPPEPAPQPEPTPEPAPQKPAPPKPQPRPAPEKPAKPDQAKPAPEKKPTKEAKPAPQKSRLGRDWLASVVGDTKKNAAPAQISAQAAAGLAQAIRQQVQPCWNPPAGGADVSRLVTTLRLQFRRDGTVIGQPQVTEQTGVSGDNQAYARQHAEAAKRAVLRCQPLQLPADLYEFWKDIEFNFDARLND